jgi:hypothetical protein
VKAQLTETDFQERTHCRQIEAAILERLQHVGLSERSAGARVIDALTDISTAPPAWIAPDAWLTWCRRVAYWAKAHGSLEVWVNAGKMHDKALQSWLNTRKRDNRADEL